MCETSKPKGNGNTSLSPPSPDFGSKMQLQGCMANSSFELRFSFNPRRCTKVHRQGELKPGECSILEQLWPGCFFAPIGPSEARKKTPPPQLL